MRFADGWCVADEAAEQFLVTSRNLVYRPGEGLSGRAWQAGVLIASAECNVLKSGETDLYVLLMPSHGGASGQDRTGA